MKTTTTLFLGLSLLLGGFGLVQAQNTTAVLKKTEVVDYLSGAATVDGAIRLVDNKGTIKFLQTANGLTTVTNTSGTNPTTTTIQLGGTLTDDTYIDVDGNVFAFNGIELVDPATESASINAVSESDAGGVGSGYTLLVRDEATGAIKKLAVSALTTTSVGVEHFDATDSQTVFTLADATVELEIANTQVYRNGVKLLATEDYTVSGNVVKLITGTTTYSVFASDVIEVHYLY